MWTVSREASTPLILSEYVHFAFQREELCRVENPTHNNTQYRPRKFSQVRLFLRLALTSNAM